MMWLVMADVLLLTPGGKQVFINNAVIEVYVLWTVENGTLIIGAKKLC